MKKRYNVYCSITKEVDFGLINFDITVDAIHIVDAAAKVECLLEKSGIEYEIMHIQLKEE